ncbi:hypothetical protein VSS74_08095 [Conexibacter stalactiti]|uniref:Secreted protein n=1 Tax=Conexibacter stalactiti TaxID=1940611 RepID=A0ABU4HLW1_9ACTN|nr:hypothetical protein [Conexibacter stalactiti]MDW5594293.1 hypothetical protein [Conexibacter stalactiti]MEC5034935.1 hypothetical protein [Conexibacter stalactiti]
MKLTKFARLAPLAVIAAGALAAPTAAQAAGSQTVVCKGSEARCTATISLAGGASAKTLKIELPGTNLKLIGVNSTPAYTAGAYDLYDPNYALGGSLFTSKLSAVKSLPKGAKLILKFGTPERLLNCGGIHTGVGGLIIETTGLGSTPAFGCPQAAGVARTWLKRFNAYQQVERFSVRGVAYRCKVVPFEVNINCTSNSTLVAFSAPTGH